MATVRESSFPAIKCSMCNADVEISQMGDHICSAEIEVKTTYSIFPLSKPKLSAGSTQAQKLASLPRIDSTAANRPFNEQNQLTPSSSATGSGGHSPPTPRDGQLLRPPIHSSSLSPHPQGQDPRKDSLASSNYNLDIPFPRSKSPRGSPISLHALLAKDNESYFDHAPLSPVATGGRNVTSRMNNIAPGPFGVNNNNNRKARLHETLPTVSSERGSSRTRKANGGSVLAGYPDREDERRQRRTEPERNNREYVVTRREGRGRDRGREQETPRRIPTPGFDYSSRTRRAQSPGSRSSRQPPKEQNTQAVPPLTTHAFGQRGGKVRTEEPISYSHQSRYSNTGSGNPKIRGLRPEDRSKTFPTTHHERSPSGRLPPHPGVGLPRSPSVTVRNKDKSSTNLSKVLPGPPPQTRIPDVPAIEKRRSALRRKPSLLSNELGENMLKSAPPRDRGTHSPLSEPPQAEVRPPSRKLSSPPPTSGEYSNIPIGSPYDIKAPVEDAVYTTSPSMSSNASSIFSHRSERSSTSTTSGPPTPDVPSALRASGTKFDRGKRGPSNVTNRTNSNGFNEIDGLMKELQNSIHYLAPTPIQDGFERGPLPVPHEHTRVPYDHRQVPIPLETTPLKLTPPVLAPLQHQPPSPGVYQQPPPPRLALLEPQPRALQYPEKLTNLRSKQAVILGSPVEELFLPPPPPPPPPPQNQQQHERPTPRSTTSRGNCRGCGEGIVGKSISSADGRLTGRYHKACFVCQDCRRPFESAEFYVHNNLPYCERHYHKLNQSLCPTCDRGIEGPCLEAERHERYHPSCFSCSECACSLSGDYFEFNERPFCEKHAYEMMQGNHLEPNRMARIERRQTRLMYM